MQTAPASADDTPGTLTHERMCFVSTATVTHALYRVQGDGTEELMYEHPDFGEGWAAGQSAVHADRDHAYALYRGRTRVARFAHARARSRQPESNLDALVMIGAGS